MMYSISKNNLKNKINTLLFFCFLIYHWGVYSQEKMEVSGAIKIGNSEAVSPEAGTIRWTGSDVLGWAGSKWVSLTLGTTYSGEVADIEGNLYQTIILGTQEWMAENLRTSAYRDGSLIPHVTNNTSWGNLTTGAYCWYDNDDTYEQPFGKIYNWFAVADARGLCPMGWHVPTDAEWTTLINFLGGAGVAGGPLKETGFNYWEFQNDGATNSSGFRGLPGSRNEDGTFPIMGFYGYWWSANQSSDSHGGDLGLFYDGIGVNQAADDKNYGFWVRCLKD